MVLQRLRKHGIKVKASKCNLFKKEFSYLGRIVSKDGYRLDPKNISAVVQLKESKPQNVGDVQRFLGLLSYFRRFIWNFSKKAKPINDLLQKPENTKDTCKGGNASSKTAVQWENKHQTALCELIDSLLQPPTLAYPYFQLPFSLQIDASGDGLGCALFQVQDGTTRVIGFGSRSQVGPEKKYHSSKLEFLGLKWAVCDHFHDYLQYA